MDIRNGILFVVVLCLALSPAAFAAVINVPGDQPTIQAGIDAAAPGDTVLVADGTYTGAGNIDLDFGGKAITVRSENGAGTCVIDCQQSGRGFSFTSGEGPDSVVEGFTIRNGMAEDGAGIYCQSASPVITGMTITDCEAGGFGGAMYALDSSLTISGCTIDSNIALWGNGAIYCEGEGSTNIGDCLINGNGWTNYDGGIYDITTGNSRISNCVISNNLGQAVYCAGPITISGNHITGNGGGIVAFWHGVVIEGNTIVGNTHGEGGGIHCACNGVVANNYIYKNEGSEGGGIHLFAGDLLLVTSNFIIANSALRGGGIYIDGVHFNGIIQDNLIVENHANLGGGIYTINGGTTPTVSNNFISGNQANSGAGMLCDFLSTTILSGNTMVGNTASHRGGGLSCFGRAEVTVTDSIFWGNTATFGYQLDIGSSDSPSTLTISYSDVEGGRPDVFVAPNCTLNWGEGMIDKNPLFVSGPLGDHCLSQAAAGQPETSPCVDAGDPAGDPVDGTTRTDQRPDTGVADMGFHYPAGQLVPRPNVIVGLGPSPENQPRIRVFPPEQDAGRINAFPAYGFSQYGVKVSCGDVDGDQLDELLTGPGPGPGYGPHVRGFEVHGTPLPGLSFQAYGTNRYGVNVAAGDLNGNGRDEIITGPGPGAGFGPHVRAFAYDGTVTPVTGVSFQAYATPKWGVNVAAGDVDGDGFDEILTGAGPGAVYGPHVRGWNVDGGTAAAIPGISFFAFNTPRYGVRVSCGDVNGDGFDEIVTTPGPSPAFAAHVRVWRFDGSSISELPEYNFLAWPPGDARCGATVFAGADLDGDGRDELVLGAGPDPNLDSMVAVYRRTGDTVSLWFSLQAFPDGWTHGANVAAGSF